MECKFCLFLSVERPKAFNSGIKYIKLRINIIICCVIYCFPTLDTMK